MEGAALTFLMQKDWFQEPQRICIFAAADGFLFGLYYILIMTP